MAYPPADEPSAAHEHPLTALVKAQLASHVMDAGAEPEDAIAAAEEVFGRHYGDPATVQGFLAMMTEAREAAGFWVHLDGTSRHHDDRYRGELSVGDLAKVTCPACLGQAGGPGQSAEG